jgi:hypothetical protein
MIGIDFVLPLKNAECNDRGRGPAGVALPRRSAAAHPADLVGARANLVAGLDWGGGGGVTLAFVPDWVIDIC